MSATETTSRAAIRDLGDEELAGRYGCDRFTATVLANRFQYIVEHMCARLLTAAFSPILRDFYDFAATLTGPPEIDYPTPAMSNSIVLFTGVMTESVRHTVEEYGVERLEPGDVIVANDPYRGGTHVNDLLFVRPVFHDGSVAGFVSMKAHQLDMGGVVPGGFTLTKRNIYEDGVVLSPRALFRRGEPVRETWSLIFDNVRFGPILFPDMQTLCAELELGERLLDRDRRALRGRRRPRRDGLRLRRRRPSASGRRWRPFPTASGRARTRPTATPSTTRRSTGSTSGSSSAEAAPRSTSAERPARRARA